LSLGKGPKLLCIKAGTFTMGSNRDSFEQPIHSVTLPAFWMDETEVTMSQYTACVMAGKCSAPPQNDAKCTYGVQNQGNYPINCVDQVQSKAFCTWAGKRLPIEEEWEYGARGTDARKFPWGDTAFSNQANFGTTGPVAVGQYPSGKSPFGLFDMIGNVQEWTGSEACSYVAAAGITPACGFSNRIWRGGSYFDIGGVDDGTATYRNADDPNGTNYSNFGFRCAKGL
jgi:formylglycine-generating enzyme required for sulfatase activity